jgi:hypothetical protein
MRRPCRRADPGGPEQAGQSQKTERPSLHLSPIGYRSGTLPFSNLCLRHFGTGASVDHGMMNQKPTHRSGFHNRPFAARGLSYRGSLRLQQDGLSANRHPIRCLCFVACPDTKPVSPFARHAVAASLLLQRRAASLRKHAQ